MPGQANQPSRFAAELERYLNSDVPILGAFKGNWYFVNLSVGSAAPDQRLLHIVLTGQHTDDHYGRLEFLAPLSDQGIADLTTAQTQYYEYDVAGIEGLHWGLMIALMILGPISSFIMNSVKPSGQKQPCSHDTFWAPLLFHFSHCMTPCDD